MSDHLKITVKEADEHLYDDTKNLMSELDICVERFSLLKQDLTDEDRFNAFYSKCAMLPISYIERAAELHRAEARALSDKAIPELMFAENRRSIETTDGVTITIRGEINASLKGADMPGVLQWLEGHGYGSIVKKKHYLDYAEVSNEVMEKLEKEGVVLHADLSLNTNSFKSAVKKIYADKDELPPPEVAEVTIFNHAVIKTAKNEGNEE
jgi:hypothetical protein